MNADSRLCAPACTLAELRTITDVIGKPPIAPAIRLPTPCAFSSRSGGAARSFGIDLLDGFEAQQRFQARDDRQRHRDAARHRD